MKSVFCMPLCVSGLLRSLNVSVRHVTDAVQSSLNATTQTIETPKFSGIRNKASEFTVRENIGLAHKGQSDIGTRFSEWSLAQEKLAKKFGAPTWGTVDCLPFEFRAWISNPKWQVVPVVPVVPVAPSNGNGKAKRNKRGVTVAPVAPVVAASVPEILPA